MQYVKTERELVINLWTLKYVVQATVAKGAIYISETISSKISYYSQSPGNTLFLIKKGQQL